MYRCLLVTSAAQKQETRKTRYLRLHYPYDLIKMTKRLEGTEHFKQENWLQRPWGWHAWHEKSSRGQSAWRGVSKAERARWWRELTQAYSILESTSVPLAFRFSRVLIEEWWVWSYMELGSGCVKLDYLSFTLGHFFFFHHHFLVAILVYPMRTQLLMGSGGSLIHQVYSLILPWCEHAAKMYETDLFLQHKQRKGMVLLKKNSL